MDLEKVASGKILFKWLTKQAVWWSHSRGCDCCHLFFIKNVYCCLISIFRPTEKDPQRTQQNALLILPYSLLRVQQPFVRSTCTRSVTEHNSAKQLGPSKEWISHWQCF